MTIPMISLTRDDGYRVWINPNNIFALVPGLPNQQNDPYVYVHSPASWCIPIRESMEEILKKIDTYNGQ